MWEDYYSKGVNNAEYCVLLLRVIFLYLECFLAFANEYDMNLLYVSGPELISKYTFDWERECGVRKILKDARNAAPCVIFFHHFDALAKTREVSSHKLDYP